MGRKKRQEPSKDKRLDEFLSNLEIEESKREQIIQFVENLTFERLKERSVGKKQGIRLRLN